MHLEVPIYGLANSSKLLTASPFLASLSLEIDIKMDTQLSLKTLYSSRGDTKMMYFQNCMAGRRIRLKLHNIERMNNLTAGSGKA